MMSETEKTLSVKGPALARSYIPHAPLNDYVDVIWYYSGYQNPHVKERLLPDGSMTLVINLNEEPTLIYDRNTPEKFAAYRGAFVTGAQSEFFLTDRSSQAHTVGIHFKPGGGSFVLGLPANELKDMRISLESIWGGRAIDLREQLLQVESVEKKFQILEQILCERIRKSTRHPAVAYALQRMQHLDHAHTVSELSDEVGLSQRRFIQVFNEEVGLTPKLFARIQRFQQVLDLVKTGSAIDWMDIAIGCGYFDQAHFIHDFKAFSGLNPTTYLSHRSEHLIHLRMREVALVKCLQVEQRPPTEV
jgi:AraC-like DNA-binding protein